MHHRFGSKGRSLPYDRSAEKRRSAVVIYGDEETEERRIKTKKAPSVDKQLLDIDEDLVPRLDKEALKEEFKEVTPTADEIPELIEWYLERQRSWRKEG